MPLSAFGAEVSAFRRPVMAVTIKELACCERLPSPFALELPLSLCGSGLCLRILEAEHVLHHVVAEGILCEVAMGRQDEG